MAREPRSCIAGGIYHVASRGNNRRPIFLTDSDRHYFLMLLDKTVMRHGWKLHAYCLMGNHFHLLVETPNANLAEGMQLLVGTYARLFNLQHGRRDHLFGRRYLCAPVRREEHFRWLTRYIVRNPVRAGLCASPGDWKWSSFAATAGSARRPRYLSVAWVLARFGASPEVARRRYRAYAEADDGPVPEGLVLIAC
jgi:putative transposase